MRQRWAESGVFFWRGLWEGCDAGRGRTVDPFLVINELIINVASPAGALQTTTSKNKSTNLQHQKGVTDMQSQASRAAVVCVAHRSFHQKLQANIGCEWRMEQARS